MHTIGNVWPDTRVLTVGCWGLNITQNNRQLRGEETQTSDVSTFQSLIRAQRCVFFPPHFHNHKSDQLKICHPLLVSIDCRDPSLRPSFRLPLRRNNYSVNHRQWAIYDPFFFSSQIERFSHFFFHTWYNVLRKMDMRTYWKHNVAEDMQVVECRAERKVMFPPEVAVVFILSKHHLSLRCASSSARLFLWVWLISQQGINLGNGLRGHLG